MAEDIRIDSHKLIFHPTRVSNWLSGQNIYPLTVELSISGGCNHRCQFCAFDYLGFQAALLEEDLLLTNLKEMAAQGVKSVVFAGEGEPLIHRSAPRIFKQAKEYGLDLAMSSNGVLLTEDIARESLPFFTWIRFSVNAGTEETYQKIHGCKPGDFQRVLANLQKVVAIKKQNKLAVTLGVQLLLIPENNHEVVTLGKILKEIGVDYYTVKPYSHHPKSINNVGVQIDYQNHLSIEKELKELEEPNGFQIYFRQQSMIRLQYQRRYHRCLGLPFWTFIDSRGNVWACSAFLGDPHFCYGNLHEHRFVEIWESKRRQEVLEYIDNMDIGNCREICRLDEINAYLNQLKHPGLHANFI